MQSKEDFRATVNLREAVESITVRSWWTSKSRNPYPIFNRIRTMDFLINARFKDFSLFQAEARAWELDFLQLDRGSADFHLVQAGTDGTQIARTHLNRKMEQRGQTPARARTFVIPMNPELQWDWLGQKVAGNDLLVFPESGDLHSLSPAGFDVVTYSVPEARIGRLCDELHIPPLANLLNGRQVLRMDPKSMAGLRSIGRQLTDALRGSQQGIPGGDFRDQVNDDFARAILRMISKFRHVSPEIPLARERSRCLKTAMELIEASGREGLTVKRICDQTNVSERSLQYAFKDYFGMGPKAYLQAWRLNRVRAALARPRGPSPTVADAANTFGFWHMGQFAADYRRLFGELPMHTIRRTQGTLECE